MIKSFLGKRLVQSSPVNFIFHWYDSLFIRVTCSFKISTYLRNYFAWKIKLTIGSDFANKTLNFIFLFPRNLFIYPLFSIFYFVYFFSFKSTFYIFTFSVCGFFSSFSSFFFFLQAAFYFLTFPFVWVSFSNIFTLMVTNETELEHFKRFQINCERF